MFRNPTSTAPVIMPQPHTPSGHGLDGSPRHYRGATPPYADRSHDYDAPDYAQRLQRACRHAYETFCELDALLAAPGMDSHTLDVLSLAAWQHWMAIEEAAHLAACTAAGAGEGASHVAHRGH